jgi:hypothetical protein
MVSGRFKLWMSLRLWYDIIYLLSAIVLTPVGSSTVHIYTQAIHRTTVYLLSLLMFDVNFLFLSSRMPIEYLKIEDKTYTIISHRKFLIIFTLYFWNNTFKYYDNQYRIPLVKCTEFVISQGYCPELFHFANYGGVFLAEFLNWAWGVCVATSINADRPDEITDANIESRAGQT